MWALGVSKYSFPLRLGPSLAYLLIPTSAGEKQRFGYDRSAYDVEESDGADEDENDNEDDDEDSQAESVLSTTPSVTASPQHHPSRQGLQDTASTDEDIRLPDCFTGVHTDSMDGLPKALLTKMTVLSAAQSASRTSRSPAEFIQQEAQEDKAQERGAGPRSAGAALADVTPPSPGRQMSVDYPDPEAALGHSLISTAALTKVGMSGSGGESRMFDPAFKDLFGVVSKVKMFAFPFILSASLFPESWE